MPSDYGGKTSPPTQNPSRLMDTEPGGENTPYESQQVFGSMKTKSISDKDSEQRLKLGSDPSRADDTNHENTRKEMMRDLDHSTDNVGNLGKANQGSAFGKVSSDIVGK